MQRKPCEQCGSPDAGLLKHIDSGTSRITLVSPTWLCTACAKQMAADVQEMVAAYKSAN